MTNNPSPVQVTFEALEIQDKIMELAQQIFLHRLNNIATINPYDMDKQKTNIKEKAMVSLYAAKIFFEVIDQISLDENKKK